MPMVRIELWDQNDAEFKRKLAKDVTKAVADNVKCPVQAGLTSALTFALGAAMPLIIVLVVPETRLIPFVFGTSLIFLAGLGTLAALTGGAPVMRSAIRVTFWGAIAMGLTAAVGALFGTIV